MTRLELFRIKSMWGNYAFDYACSMARGLSGGLISIWDPNMFSKNSIWCDDSFIIIKGNWKNVVGDYFMVNIYGPQDLVSKLALWNRLTDFMHHHNGSYIMFGDMNAVRNAQERFGTTLNSIEADHFNFFIDSIGLVDLSIGGRSFTWMNKAGTKLSKLDRFFISKDVTIRLPDVRITALDRLWSDHNPILLHIDKTDFGPSPFKLYNSWLLRDSFDNLIKEEWELLDSKLKCHEKFCRLKDKIKQWSNNIKTLSQFFREHSILLMEAPTSEFSIKRGLGKRDPLLLLLFQLGYRRLSSWKANLLSNGVPSDSYKSVLSSPWSSKLYQGPRRRFEYKWFVASRAFAANIVGTSNFLHSKVAFDLLRDALSAIFGLSELKEINSIEKRIDEGSAMPSYNNHRLILFQEIQKIDKFASMDLIQKARVKWDIEGDENSKFFHGLINQKRRNQMINGIMVE
ncbi:RNA-directed DNA polymerase, eukaryota, reverse transcriptase zinc-binding domain protein [Tanacetum coccineum]